MEKEFDFNSVAGCNEGLVELADIFNDINSELDEITEALRGTKSRKKVDCLLEKYYVARSEEIKSHELCRRLRDAKRCLLNQD